MKKSAVLVLALVCALALIGCGTSAEKNGALSLDKAPEIDVVFSNKTVPLSQEDGERLYSILKNGSWDAHPSGCDPDYTVVVADAEMLYHSDCGTFSDNELDRAFIADEETQKLIAAIFEKYFD